MKTIKNILFLLLLVVMITLSFNLNTKAEDDEEYIELDYYYYRTTTKVKIPKNYETKEAEMRGAWVSTAWNGDFKKQSGTDAKAIEGFKEQYRNVLDTLEKYNMNTIFFQVRPCNDAFYKSEINQWSQFLVGAGVDPGWDPLEWMVEETHNRGMEFQCWMNAFRVTIGSILPSGTYARNYNTTELLRYKKTALNTMADNNYAKLHPEAVLMGSSDCKLILNPGDLGVQQHLVNTLKEIVENYDVDGLHFDDYFYLYVGDNDTAAQPHSERTNTNFAGGEYYDKNLTGENTLNDLPTYKDYQDNPTKYNMPAGLSLGDFRRESINNMMKSIREMIDAHNTKTGKNVEYGSKPAAVWQSNVENCTDPNDSGANADPEGSNTACHAYSSNWNLYADTKKWVEEGWVDWIAPQVYYNFGSSEAPYADIVTWWADVVTKTNEKREAQGLKPIKMYVAHGVYHYNGGRFTDAKEIPNQLKFNQMFDCIKGSAVYNFTNLMSQTNNISKAGISLFKNIWKTPVFSLPRGENNIGDAAVGNTKLIKSSNGDVRVTFDKLENAKGYALYKIEKGKPVSFDTKYRVDILYEQYSDEPVVFQLKDYDPNYDYYLRAVSTTNHLSTKATKISTDMVENEGPSEVTINFNDGKEAILFNKVYATMPYSKDPEGDKLTYEVEVSVTGIDGRFYDVDKITDNGSGLEIMWESYLAGEDCVIRVIISDGDKSVTCYSNSIVIKDPSATPVVKQYTVTFLDEDGNVLKTEKVNSGASATAPTAPTKDGHQFIGWDQEFDEVTSDLEIKPLFEVINGEKPSEDKKGCKKDLTAAVISLISLTTVLVFFKKRH